MFGLYLYNVQYLGVKHNKNNGVYIEATDGVLYTNSSWDTTKIANGIVIITDKISIRMALVGENKSIEISYTSYDTSQPSFATSEDAMNDFDGRINTGYILTQNGRASHFDDVTYAAPYVKTYVFPDGVTTNGYILSVGEWNEIALYAEEVNNCLTKVGGVSIKRNNWTSTHLRAHGAYPIYYWCSINNSYTASYPAHAGYRGIDGLYTSARPCTTYINDNPIIIT